MKRNIVLLLAIGLLASTGICTVAQAASDKQTITDGMGREVEISTDIRRAVIGNRYALEMVRSVGAIDKVAAIDSLAYSNEAFWPEFTEADVYGRHTNDLDYEKLLSYDPDIFVLIPGIYKDEVVEKLAEYDIPVVVVDTSTANGMDAYYDQIRLVGQIFDCEAGAQKVIDFASDTRSEIDKRLEGLNDTDRVGMYLEYTEPYMTSFSDSGAIYDAMGKNVIDASMETETSDFADPEAVISSNPALIVKAIYTGIADGSGTDNYLPPSEADYLSALEEMRSRSGFKDMNAVKNGDIVMCSDFVLRGCANTVGAAFFAKWLHPDLFEDFDPYDIFNTWMKFQGLEPIEGHVYYVE